VLRGKDNVILDDKKYLFQMSREVKWSEVKIGFSDGVFDDCCSTWGLHDSTECHAPFTANCHPRKATTLLWTTTLNRVLEELTVSQLVACPTFYATEGLIWRVYKSPHWSQSSWPEEQRLLKTNLFHHIERADERRIADTWRVQGKNTLSHVSHIFFRRAFLSFETISR
jgi:hypothetical protein